MSISDALNELDMCDFLKVTKTSIHASRWARTRGGYGPPDGMAPKDADVMIRRRKSESFEAMLLRAAGLVRAGHRPTIRVPTLTSADRCACGRQGHDLTLAWNSQLHQWLCRSCMAGWATAGRNNDMRSVKTDVVM